MMDIKHIAPEDLALFAMHALPPEEAAGISTHLEICGLCREEAAQIRGDMALLALSVEQHSLPDGAEERFMQRVAAAPRAPADDSRQDSVAVASVLPFAPAAARRKRWPVYVPWAVAAGLTAVCVSLGMENKNLSDTLNTESILMGDLRVKAAQAQQIADVLNAPAAQRVTLTLAKHAAEPTGHAIYLPDRGSLLFEGNNLAKLDPGKTYQLWVIPASGSAPVPAGTFKPNASGYATLVLPKLPAGVAAKAFGVTIENDGGALTPTMPIVLAGG